MQYFHWDIENDGTLWKKLKEDARHLSAIGITALWLPPAYKGCSGIDDVGYGVYDLYDLGEFDQKGTIRTKYGTKDEYLDAIKECHKYGIDIYADMVFNHKMGADHTDSVEAIKSDPNDRNKDIAKSEMIKAWTHFDFKGRHDKYSTFKWTAKHFTGVDYDDRSKHKAIYRFKDELWSKDVSSENGNYDYLMGADVDVLDPEVKDELYRYGLWYLDFTDVDGFRLDALKHIDDSFFRGWLAFLREKTHKELFTVGEYWSNDIAELTSYLKDIDRSYSLFDVPLHYHFFEISNGGGYFDMGAIFNDTLVQNDPQKAVTFVENHDTQIGQALQTVVADWFKPMAYACILLREEGYPCIFYGDYYGIDKYKTKAFKEIIDKMLDIRKTKMSGKRHDYLDDRDIIGWTYEGLKDDEGFAVILDDGPGGMKVMDLGKRNANKTFIDISGNSDHEVTTDIEGRATFSVEGGNFGIYVARSFKNER